MTAKNNSTPERILLFSGKRKSGKDYLTEKLLQLIGEDKCEIIRISEPIKSFWAKNLNLNLDELLSDGPYKEKYRQEMIEWSDLQRAKDYGIFCREAIVKATKSICIVSDIRRKTDIKWFLENYGQRIIKIKIHCSNETRMNRGWQFKKGVDDVQSECDLDDVMDWDCVIENEDKKNSDVGELLKPILNCIYHKS